MTENSIIFHAGEPAKVILTLSKNGVVVDPDVPCDEAAQKVLEVLDVYIKRMVQAAVDAEREACAKICENLAANDKLSNYYKVAANAIRGKT